MFWAYLAPVSFLSPLPRAPASGIRCVAAFPDDYQCFDISGNAVQPNAPGNNLEAAVSVVAVRFACSLLLRARVIGVSRSRKTAT